jgi:ribosomal protein L37AE/L43A
MKITREKIMTSTTADIVAARTSQLGACTCEFVQVGPGQFTRPDTDPQCPVHAGPVDCPFCGDTDTRPMAIGWYCQCCGQRFQPVTEPHVSVADLNAFADAIEDYVREYAQDGAR